MNHGVRKIVRAACCALTLCAAMTTGLAQAPEAGRILDWMESPANGGSMAGWIRERSRMLTDYVVRATSPDVPGESRRLWILDLSTGSKCLLSTETGVHEPRWGSNGLIAYLVDADTDGDGRIDFNDEQVIRVVPASGGDSRKLGVGRSVAWAPDGKALAVISKRQVRIIDLSGAPVAASATTPAGNIVVADSRSPSRTSRIWSIEARTGRVDALDAELTRKYLWIGAITRDGRRAAFSSALHDDLYVGDPSRPESAENVTRDGDLDFEPSWSPDERRLVYVSTRSGNAATCR